MPTIGSPIPASAPARRSLGWLRRVLPLASLLAGVLSAVLMDRREEVVARLVVVLSAGWVLGTLTALLSAAEQERQLQEPWERGRTGSFTRLRRRPLFALAERTVIQLCLSQALFFPLPSYLRSAVPTPAQVVFLAVLLLACAVVLVDGLFNQVYQRPAWFAALLGISGFVTLQFALPMLTGFSLHEAQRVAVALSLLVASLPGLWRDWRVPWVRAQRLTARAVWLLMGWGGLEAGMGRAVPPVPLRLVAATACDDVIAHLPVAPSPRLLRAATQPQPLWCFTQVKAPITVTEHLVHVWWHGGVEVNRVGVPVQGTPQDGYLMQSRTAALGPQPFGQWRCEVQTERGQVLGGVDFTVEPLSVTAPPQSTRIQPTTSRVVRRTPRSITTVTDPDGLAAPADAGAGVTPLGAADAAAQGADGG